MTELLRVGILENDPHGEALHLTVEPEAEFVRLTIFRGEYKDGPETRPENEESILLNYVEWQGVKGYIDAVFESTEEP